MAWLRGVALACMCIWLAACSTSYQEAGLRADAQPQPAGGTSGRYFVEFRAVMPVFPGHSYFVHGRLDENGVPVEESEPIGFYPLLGPVGGSTLGLFAIPGLTAPDPGDAKKHTVESYRVELDVDRHSRLMSFVSRWRSEPEPWSLLFNNCNDFIADAARTIGLKAPEGLAVMPPYVHIRKLRQLNSI